MTIDKSTNTPYVVSDDSTSGEAIVTKYTGGAWHTVGSPNFTSSKNGVFYTNIATDSSGNPVVAFQNDNGPEQTSTYQFSNGQWHPLGPQYFSPGHAYYVSMAVGVHTNPVVLFLDETNYQQGTVMYYSNGAWAPLGAPGFVTASSFTQNSIIVTGTDSGYIAFADKNNGFKATVMQYVPLVSPVITSFLPASAYTGVTVTIKGTAFTGATAVYFGGSPATSFNVVSDSVITAVVGNGATGNITVTTPSGPASKAGFVFCNPNPPTVAISDGLTSTTICAGTKVTFTATATNGGAKPVYQWLKNGLKVGLNNATYTDSLLKTGDSVLVTVTDSAACSTQKTGTSKAIKFIVNPAAAPLVTITDSVGTTVGATTICTGTAVKFKAVATNAGTTVAYQWMKNGLKVGINNSIYNDSYLKTGDSVWVVVTGNASCSLSNSVKSNTLTFTVNTTVAPSATITDSVGTTVGATTICTGTAVKFKAVVANAGTTPTYQWRKNGIKVGVNNSIYNDSYLKTGDSVWVVITSNNQCSLIDSAKSNTIKFTVNAFASPSVAITDSVGTTVGATTICTGTAVKFKAVATNAGATPTYQWRKNGIKVGINNSIYNDSYLKTGDSVWVVVTGDAPCSLIDSAKSNPIKFTVNAYASPSVAITDSIGTTVGATTICTGTAVKFKAVATNAGATPIYQWRKNGIKVGINNSIYNDSYLKAGDSVWVVVTGDAPCSLIDSAKSKAITFSVQTGIPAEPSAISGPATVIAGQKGIVFKVTGVAGIIYEWTVPSQDTITSGQGLDSIAVTWHVAGAVSVKAGNACGTSAAVTKSVAVTAGIINPVEEKFALVTATLYPNPANDAAKLQINGFSGKVAVTITDLTGKTVWRQAGIANGSYTLPLANLASGVYIVTIRDNKYIKSIKLVKTSN